MSFDSNKLTAGYLTVLRASATSSGPKAIIDGVEELSDIAAEPVTESKVVFGNKNKIETETGVVELKKLTIKVLYDDTNTSNQLLADASANRTVLFWKVAEYPTDADMLADTNAIAAATWSGKVNRHPFKGKKPDGTSVHTFDIYLGSDFTEVA